MKITTSLLIAASLMACSAPPVKEHVLVSEATVFAPGVVSTEANSEFEIMFSPDAQTAYFARRAPEQKQKIYETKQVNGQWSSPTLCTFSTDRDEAPSLTPDGAYFFFGSAREMPGLPNLGNFDMNIWVMKRSDEGWGTPEPLPFPINDVQEEGEGWPSSNANFFSCVGEDTFYFTTMVRGSKAVKLYETRMVDGGYTAPVEITGLFDDPKYWIYSPVVSPDGKYLVFNSFGAPGGSGGEDIFVAQRTSTGWSRAVPIGSKVNTTDEESTPRFSPDGAYFYFSRAANLGDYEYGEWDIYYLSTSALGLEGLFR